LNDRKKFINTLISDFYEISTNLSFIAQHLITDFSATGKISSEMRECPAGRVCEASK